MEDKKEKKNNIESIESDSDFDKYNLDDMDVNELDALPDNRKSKFYKMSYLEIIIRFIAFIIIVYINEM